MHLGPRAAFRETPASRGELEASPHPSRPPASRGRNVKDQLSAELRLPFRGAPRAAELTGSVCPTGRTAPAKNSALPRAAGPQPRQSKEPGEPRTPPPGPGPVPPPRPRRKPRAQRRPLAGRGGWKARAPRSGLGRAGWEPVAGPPARSPGPPCPCWGLRPARSVSTRSAAEVRRAAAGVPPPFPGTGRGPLLLPHPRSAAGGGGGRGGGRGRTWASAPGSGSEARSQALSCKLTCSLKKSQTGHHV